MKRLLFICFVSIMLIALILPACAAPKVDVVKIGVIGPMKFMEGENHWNGAVLARDEINAAGGVNLNGKKYQIELIKSDSNEILNPTEAASAMERLITVDKPDFVVGGFRTEGVMPMQEVAMNYKKIFLNSGAATRALQAKVVDNYDRYKYFFKVTPYNEYFLVTSDFKMLSMVGTILKQQLGITEPLRVAIVAEKLTWADAMVTTAQATIPKLGMAVTGVWRPSDTATDVNAELTAIAATNPHIIFPTFSGPVGVTFSKQAGEMQIPAAIVGIVVEAQKQGFWEATGGKGNYVMTLNTYAKGVAVTDKTLPFFANYEKKFGQFPSYTAATYDAVYMLKQVVEKAQSLDPEVLVPLIEKIEFNSTAGLIKYYPVGPDTKAPACPHDIMYGPGLTTGIGTQWQNGALKGVWPAKGIGSGGFETIDYPGIVPYIINPLVVQKFQQPAATPPAAK
jgi:branched-chain amino acid transport system substrate-binding protein